MSGARERYLEAMGIQGWVPRVEPPVAEAVVTASVESTPAMPLQTEPPASQQTTDTPISELGWSALETRVAHCTQCGLHASRTHTVFGIGAHDADWMIVGEGPGAEEDRLGEPFVGRAGQLLNNMLRALGLQRDVVYIGNIVKCRPPGNRDPKPEEAAACRPYLERQIALVQPRLLLAVGRIAAQNLLDTDTPVGKLRGRVHRYGAARIPVIVTYHPAYLLRSPEQKAKAWDDLCLARAYMESDT